MINKEIKYDITSSEQLGKEKIQKLLNQKLDVVVTDHFININQLEALKNELSLIHSQISSDFKLDLPDGIFFPFPYSSIRNDQGNGEDAYRKYLKSNIEFSKKSLQSTGQNIIQEVLNKITDIGSAKLLHFNPGEALSPLGFRLLYSERNGIDVHCENAFLNQLDHSFKAKMKKTIDLENIISAYLTIQSPEAGGELVLFNKDWEDISININHTGYEERHDMEGSLFTNRGYAKPDKLLLEAREGSLTIFRAAQIWHGINCIKGSKDRITIGCFFGMGKDGNIYYWA